MRERMSRAGIHWVALAYHKMPSAPATAYDIAVGTSVAVTLARWFRVQIVHARSYVPALMALAVKRATGARFLFDMRGFWADERVEGGLWPRDGRLFRLAKSLEDRFLHAADHVVTLTHASCRELANFPVMRDRSPPVSVIPTCADLKRFKPQDGPGETFTLGYVGSLGTSYMLDETLKVFAEIQRRRSEARLLFINRGEHNLISAAADRLGLARKALRIIGARHDEVPALISQMHAGTAFYSPTFSASGRAPTKLAEYLGCGVPCIGNAGVGDLEEILVNDRVGVVLRGFGHSDHARAVDDLLALLDDPDLRTRCVAAARARFSLAHGVAAYRGIYERLLASRSGISSSARSKVQA